MPRLTLSSRSVDALTEDGCLSVLELELLPDYIKTQRWFASKDEIPESVRIKQHLAFETDDRSLLLIIEVVAASGDTVNYQLPVTLTWERPASETGVIADVVAADAQGWLVDAYSDDRFIRSLFSTPALPQRLESEPRISFQPTAALEPAALTDARIKRPGAEQSNTSILVGPTILKAYRSLAQGVHPEQEIGQHLTELKFAGVPPLLGTIELSSSDGPPTILGIMQELVPEAADGWSYVTGRLPRLISGEQAAADDIKRVADRLGSCTAGLHLALASRTDNPDFTPQPVSADWIQEWSDEITASATTTLTRLNQNKSRDNEHASLRISLEDVKACIAAAASVKPTFSTIRVHGDYHLGQVLVTASDIFIVDFEGEPMRPLAVRRQKQTPLRDVAGMLRSFDYALASHEMQHGSAPEAAHAIRQAKRIFLQSYHHRIRGSDGFPASLEEANKILTMGLLEKTLYEIAYELNNRPDWVSIPLRGMHDLVESPETNWFKS